MSRKGVRSIAQRFPTKRLADGSYLCRYCDKPVVRPRLYWCSHECVMAALLACDGASQRRAVFERDKGVCALCGLNTNAIEAAYYGAKTKMWNDLRAGKTHGETDYALGWRLEKEIDGRLKVLNMGDHLWEVDHVVPVCEGGGELGLDNLRTACVPCHKGVTAKLAARRARRRKEDAA